MPALVKQTGPYFLLFLLAAGLYLFWWDVAWFWDDFQMVWSDPEGKILYWFAYKNPQNGFYRPIQGAMLALSQAWYGGDNRFLHAVQFLLHGAMGSVIFWGLRRFGFSLTQALVAGILMVVSQGATLAVLSNDTFSQLLGTLTGVSAVLLIGLVLKDSRFRVLTHPMIWVALFLVGVSLLSKESSAIFPAIVVAMLWLGAVWGNLKAPSAWTRFLFQALPFVAVTLLYLVVRQSVVGADASLGESKYNFALGMNIPKNVLLLLASGLMPASTVTAFLAAKTRDFVVLGGIGLLTAVWCGVLVWGIVHRRYWRWGAIFGGVALLGTFPMALLNHVSELYVYNSLPFLCALSGIAVGGLLAERSGAVRWVVGAVLGVVVLANVLGVEGKAQRMHNNGVEAAALLNSAVREAEELPENARMVLQNPPTDRPLYSIFEMNGFELIQYADDEIKRLAHRPDLTVEIPRKALVPKAIDGAHVFTVLGTKLVPVN